MHGFKGHGLKGMVKKVATELYAQATVVLTCEDN